VSSGGQPNYVNYIMANNGNLCINSASQNVLTYQQSGANSPKLDCMPKTVLGQANIDAMIGHGYNAAVGKNWADQSVDFLCSQGDRDDIISSSNNINKQAIVQDCNSANITVNNNGSSRDYAPVPNTASGYQKVSGSSNTNYDQLQLNVYAQGSWENIERYCKKPDAEVCY
jgi:hypothetical protein